MTRMHSKPLGMVADASCKPVSDAASFWGERPRGPREMPRRGRPLPDLRGQSAVTLFSESTTVVLPEECMWWVPTSPSWKVGSIFTRHFSS